MSQNMSEVHLSDGRVVCLSYGVPVAAFIPVDYLHAQPNATEYQRKLHGYIKTDKRFSMTTSRHANMFCGLRACTVPDPDFVALIQPVMAKGR